MFSIPSFAALAQFSGVLHLSVFHQASHRVQGRVPSEIFVVTTENLVIFAKFFATKLTSHF